MKILVALPVQEQEFAELITNSVQNIGPISVDLVKNATDAYNVICSKDYRLLILALHLPHTSDAPLNPEEETGISLLQRLAENRRIMPSILLTEHMDTRTFSRIQALQSCVPLLRGDEGWQVSLMSKVRQQLGLSVPTHAKQVCYADIELDLASRSGRYCIRGNCLQGTCRPLEQLDFERLGRLVVLSRAVGNLEDWKDMFRTIGQELLEELFRKNYFFIRDFNRAVASLRSIESIRFRFVVGDSAHPLAFEALLDDDKNYRILQSPVYRRIQTGGGVALPGDETVDRDPSAWHCLIILANTQGYVSGWEDTQPQLNLPPLPHVSSEGQLVYSCLKNKVALLMLVDGSSQNAASRHNLVQVLKHGRWDMVHFAGHWSWDERESGKATLFLRGENGEPESLSIDQLAVLLREAGTRFVYLSSCKSSGCGVALARNHIPSVVGYRWEVDDELAVEQAALFYTHLLEYQESIEMAFLRTRQEMHDRHPDNRIWASSVLISQSELDWKAA